MSSRKKKSAPTGSRYWIIVVVLVFAAAVVCVWWVMNNKMSVEPPVGITKEPQSPAREYKKVTIYVLKSTDGEIGLSPEERTVTGNVEPLRAAIERLLATNHEVGTSQGLVPVGTKLLSAKVRGSVAYLDFSSELQNNFTGGSTQEELLVGAIAHTACQFKPIKKVQILIEGKKIDSIGGHIEIIEPVVPDPSLLVKGGRS